MDKIRQLFEAHGSRDYIGEKGISQLAHALQCAALAEEAKESDEMVAACLCHDVGHLLAFTGKKVELMGKYGVAQHEELGAAWLLDCGFGEDVAALVRNHVRVKRYRARDPGYAAELSPASQKTLKYQGGPMTDKEARDFENAPLFAESCRLREYDNAAKVPGKPTPTLAHFLQVAARAKDN